MLFISMCFFISEDLPLANQPYMRAMLNRKRHEQRKRKRRGRGRKRSRLTERPVYGANGDVIGGEIKVEDYDGGFLCSYVVSTVPVLYWQFVVLNW